MGILPLRMRSLFKVYLKPRWGEHPFSTVLPTLPYRVWNVLPPGTVHCEPLILGTLP